MTGKAIKKGTQKMNRKVIGKLTAWEKKKLHAQKEAKLNRKGKGKGKGTRLQTMEETTKVTQMKQAIR